MSKTLKLTDFGPEIGFHLSDGDVVLSLYPSMCGWSEESEGKTGIVMQTIDDFVNAEEVNEHGDLLYDVLAFGEFYAITGTYYQLEGRCIAEVYDALTG